jgi:hypothetical protein
VEVFVGVETHTVIAQNSTRATNAPNHTTQNLRTRVRHGHEHVVSGNRDHKRADQDGPGGRRVPAELGLKILAARQPRLDKLVLVDVQLVRAAALLLRRELPPELLLAALLPRRAAAAACGRDAAAAEPRAEGRDCRAEHDYYVAF